MNDKVKKISKQVTTEARSIFDSAEEFILSTSLLICAFYNYYDLSIRTTGNVEYYVRLIASVVIALWGAQLLVVHFRRKKV